MSIIRVVQDDQRLVASIHSVPGCSYSVSWSQWTHSWLLRPYPDARRWRWRLRIAGYCNCQQPPRAMSLKGFATCSQNLPKESARNMYYRIICFAKAFKMVGCSDRTYLSYRSEPLKLRSVVFRFEIDHFPIQPFPLLRASSRPQLLCDLCLT